MTRIASPRQYVLLPKYRHHASQIQSNKLIIIGKDKDVVTILTISPIDHLFHWHNKTNECEEREVTLTVSDLFLSSLSATNLCHSLTLIGASGSIPDIRYSACLKNTKTRADWNLLTHHHPFSSPPTHHHPLPPPLFPTTFQKYFLYKHL